MGDKDGSAPEVDNAGATNVFREASLIILLRPDLKKRAIMSMRSARTPMRFPVISVAPIRGWPLGALVAGLLCSSALIAQEAPAPVIRINGTGSALADNIRAHIGSIDEACNATGRRLNQLVPAIRRDVERAAQALGHYRMTQQVQFTPMSGEPGSATESCWQLEISIQAEPPVTIGTVNIDFSEERHRPLFQPIFDAMPVVPGEQLNHGNYERLKSQLSSYATEYGFFAARFSEAELAVDLQRNQADINLNLELGNRYRFGEIRINQLDALSDEFVSRFLTLEPGSEYSAESLVELRQNFNDSQYFSHIAITPQVAQAVNEEIPIDVELETRPRRSYTTGVGVSTDVGPRLRFAFEDRYINRRGHRLNAELGISPLQQEPSISYLIPLHDPVNDSLRLSAGFQGLETDSYITDTYQAGVTWRSLVWSNWVQNVFVNFQHEQAQLKDAARERTRTNSTISGINWTRTRSNDPIYPTRGWRLFGQVSGAHENLLSDITFGQLYSSAKVVQQVGRGRFLVRGEVATTFADEVLELPLSVRFFTGGDLSVRGYQYGALGAQNSDGEIVGGKHLLVGSVEYDIRVFGGWHAAVFMDAGNSFHDLDDIELRKSVGLGIRWLSPIGPIRLDVARGLDDGGYRFHITMGPDL